MNSGFSVALQTTLPWRARLLVAMFEQLQCGSIRLSLPNGYEQLFRGSVDGPHADLQIYRWSAINRILQGGDIGVAESYRDGDIDSSDMLQVLLLALANEQALDRAVHGSFAGTLLYRLRHWLNRNTKHNSKKNIHAHYDIGNDFYRLWLDSTMTYSSALFSRPEQDLVSAQQAKYERLLQLLGVKAGDHILEIGCGWGGFAEYAARHYGCRVTGVSLSPSQLNYARQRLANTDIAHLVDFHFCDYRDLTGQYDAIVSIEMLEAVGEAWWPTYFAKVKQLLKTGAKAAIQTITISNQRFESYRQSTDFIQQYIFWGGMLPSPQKLQSCSQNAGLRISNWLDFGLDYAETLKRWRLSFEQQLPAIRLQGFDQHFIRLWRFYYWYCEAGFLTRRTDVCQLILQQDFHS